MKKQLNEVKRLQKIAGILREDYENPEVNKVYGALYKILDAAGFSDYKDYTLMHNTQRDPNTVYVVVRDPNRWPEINKTIRDAVQSGTVQFGKIEPKVIDFKWWKTKVLGEPMPPSKYGPGEDEEEFDEDELPPINKAELISFIRKAGPKPTGAKPRGEYNVSLEYIDHPSIPDSYMTGARDVFMCVVKACGGKAVLEGEPGANQMYTVTGCSFDNLQAIWQFLASDQTYETAGDSDTIVQANGCAQTWEINSDYDQGDGGDDEPVRPRDPNAPDFYDDPEGALKYYKSKKKY